MLGMAALSPSHTQDIGHQGCTTTVHGSPIINFHTLSIYFTIFIFSYMMALFIPEVPHMQSEFIPMQFVLYSRIPTLISPDNLVDRKGTLQIT